MMIEKIECEVVLDKVPVASDSDTSARIFVPKKYAGRKVKVLVMMED